LKIIEFLKHIGTNKRSGSSGDISSRVNKIKQPIATRRANPTSCKFKTQKTKVVIEKIMGYKFP
jgi:hypothetical protein